jgi:hypothetical protein
MKYIITWLVIAVVPAACAATNSYVNFVRQKQMESLVVWDMPVQPTGAAQSALTLENGGALFQLWTINQTQSIDHLLDQKLVGAYLPKATVKVTTLDPYSRVPRTRVDQPFKVEINITDLLTGVELPRSATSVLLERHLGSYAAGSNSLDAAAVLANTPYSSAYLSANGKTVMQFSASSLTATDPTKASGEEHFAIHALADANVAQTQIASGFVQVWPIASGQIKGITPGQQLRFQAPPIELLLNDLYPRSDTYLLLYVGTQINGNSGVIVKSFPMDRETSESHVISVTELDSKLGNDGVYSLALVSDTVYGRELLCSPVSFNVKRTMEVNAMQVNFSDYNSP